MRPGTTQLVVAVVQVAPPGVAVTVEEVMSAPPSVLGAVQDTIAELSANTPTAPVGAPGTVDGVAMPDASEAELAPRALSATTVKV